MVANVLLLIQPSPVSVSLGAVILAMIGLLLLATALGGLLALRWRASARPSRQAAPVSPAPRLSSPHLDRVLDVLPFPAVLVDPDGRPLVANVEAAPWLEAGSPPRLASPLRTLARRVADSQQAETVRVTPAEGQVSSLVFAGPLPGDRPGVRGTGVLLLAMPGPAGVSLDLTRLVAHELRTPLTAIVGHAEILESCSPSEEALWRRSRNFIAAETQRLARLVDDLLALSRLEASPPLVRTVNLRTVVESALSFLFDRAEAAGLTLTLDAPAGLPRVHVDPGRLEQALVNLLDNAVKYTPAGGTVVARLASEGGYVRVEIGDTGPGIPPEDLPHLFEPLYRAESVRGLPGTGLGLTIVRAILDQHGVPISVQSTPGRGTTFTFRLPIAR